MENGAMDLNTFPAYDNSDNPTGCCPRFQPDGWDNQDLHFINMPFVKARTHSVCHIPVNMRSVFKRTLKAIDQAHAQKAQQVIVLSRELSPWSAEHYFAVDRAVPGESMVCMTGDYKTRVFEGPYRSASTWQSQMEEQLKERGEHLKAIYFFYTTCPKCARTYGKNYVVAIAQLEPRADTDHPQRQTTPSASAQQE